MGELRLRHGRALRGGSPAQALFPEFSFNTSPKATAAHAERMAAPVRPQHAMPRGRQRERASIVKRKPRLRSALHKQRSERSCLCEAYQPIPPRVWLSTPCLPRCFVQDPRGLELTTILKTGQTTPGAPPSRPMQNISEQPSRQLHVPRPRDMRGRFGGLDAQTPHLAIRRHAQHVALAIWKEQVGKRPERVEGKRCRLGTSVDAEQGTQYVYWHSHYYSYADNYYDHPYY